MSNKTMLDEVMFDLYDVSYSQRLPQGFKSWKEFYTYQAEKLADITSSIFSAEE